MPGSLAMNGVVVRRNMTLKDMLMSVICHSILPELLWPQELKIAAYMLNSVLTKATVKTSSEL